jgi:hypothetical protein
MWVPKHWSNKNSLINATKWMNSWLVFSLEINLKIASPASYECFCKHAHRALSSAYILIKWLSVCSRTLLARSACWAWLLLNFVLWSHIYWIYKASFFIWYPNKNLLMKLISSGNICTYILVYVELNNSVKHAKTPWLLKVKAIYSVQRQGTIAHRHSVIPQGNSFLCSTDVRTSEPHT